MSLTNLHSAMLEFQSLNLQNFMGPIRSLKIFNKAMTTVEKSQHCKKKEGLIKIHRN